MKKLKKIKAYGITYKGYFQLSGLAYTKKEAELYLKLDKHYKVVSVEITLTPIR